MLLNIVAGKVFGINFVKNIYHIKTGIFGFSAIDVHITAWNDCTIGCYITIYAEISCINSNCTFCAWACKEGIRIFFTCFCNRRKSRKHWSCYCSDNNARQKSFWFLNKSVIHFSSVSVAIGSESTEPISTICRLDLDVFPEFLNSLRHFRLIEPEIASGSRRRYTDKQC